MSALVQHLKVVGRVLAAAGAILAAAATVVVAARELWEVFFAPRPTTERAAPPGAQAPAPSTGAFTASARNEILGYRLLNKDLALGVFEVDHVYDPAFHGPVSVRITVHSGNRTVAHGRALAQPSGVPTRVEVRAGVGERTSSDHMIIKLLNGDAEVASRRYNMVRNWAQ